MKPFKKGDRDAIILLFAGALICIRMKAKPTLIAAKSIVITSMMQRKSSIITCLKSRENYFLSTQTPLTARNFFALGFVLGR